MSNAPMLLRLLMDAWCVNGTWLRKAGGGTGGREASVTHGSILEDTRTWLKEVGTTPRRLSPVPVPLTSHEQVCAKPSTWQSGAWSCSCNQYVTQKCLLRSPAVRAADRLHK